MNDDELLALVRRVDPRAVRLPPGIKAIAEEIQAVEREACAKVCDNLHRKWHWGDDNQDSGPNECAEQIRARSNAKGEPRS